MARQRAHKRRGSLENLYEQKPRIKRTTTTEPSSREWWQSKLIKLAGITAASIFCYFAQKGYRESYLTTPFASERAVDDGTTSSSPDRFWGTYRSGLYFGMKTRTPGDLLTGLMWMMPELVRPNDIGLRHWCEQGDDLEKYGWAKHDGEAFGVQEIFDRGVKLTTSFVKHMTPRSRSRGGSWTARIRAEMKDPSKTSRMVSFFYYAALDVGAEGLIDSRRGAATGEVNVRGKTSHLGEFRLFTRVGESDAKNVRHFFHSAVTERPKPEDFTNTVLSSLRVHRGSKDSYVGLDESRNRDGGGAGEFVVVQINAELPFEFDVVFQSSADFDQPELSSQLYTESLTRHAKAFDERFESTFNLKSKGFDDKGIEFAQAALSNMIGGIGYFYGHSIVKSELISEPRPYWNAPLYTGVPSRSFFPRGFLWDEGFHNLLISKWSPEISADIIAHWLDLLNCEGWIPREQILGGEARAKVPPEFVVQSNKNANPPTLVLTLHSMVRDLTSGGKKKAPDWFAGALRRMWPRLVSWLSWFDATQAGSAPGTFRWRGRDPGAVRELNPKTLTSGLDDFPRASHPTDDERHVDLRCWMAMASSLMADIGNILGYASEAKRYAETAAVLSDNALLDAMHWSDEHEGYLDYGLHSEGVLLQRPTTPHGQERRDKIRVVITEPKLQFVNQIGYISLFPLILGVLKPSSPNLPKVLATLEDPKKLFTPFGLRSLSKEASLYNKQNTEHDPPYWRGPIWLNINYLVVRALRHLSRAAPSESVRADAARIYDKIRKALVDNVMKEYWRTGYIWEQYDDKTGKGKGCKPFTGWSALVVLLMGENY